MSGSAPPTSISRSASTWQRCDMALSTPNSIAAGQRRTLRAMREKLLRMATAWDGISGALEYEIVQLADQVEAQAMRLVPDPPTED